jgi:hypothetical protein
VRGGDTAALEDLLEPDFVFCHQLDCDHLCFF